MYVDASVVHARIIGAAMTHPLTQVVLTCPRCLLLTAYCLLIRRVLPPPLIERLILRATSSA